MGNLPNEQPPFPFKIGLRSTLAGTLLEERIRKICMALDAMNVAVALSNGHASLLGNIAPESWLALHAPIPRLTVIIPGLTVLAGALGGLRFDPIFIEFKEDFEYPAEELASDISLVNHFYYDVVAAQFSLFFEEFYSDVKQACNFNYDNMHPTWSFGRRIRDAISHGDLITINDPNFRPVSWRGYTIGPQQNGTVLSNSFTAGDLIVLMCELERALPRQGGVSPSQDR